jgi:flagellar protein FlgJ
MQPLKGAGLKFRPAPPTPEEQDKLLKKVSADQEKLFLRLMTKGMRTTLNDENSLVPVSAGEKIFREQLDDEYVEHWGNQGGIGLQNIIYDQLLEKFGPAMGIKKNVQPPKGPISFNESAQVKPGAETSPRFKLNYELKPGMSDRDVLSPWSGTLVGQKKVDAQNTLLELKHGNGVTSRLIFNGQPEALKLGDEIAAGQKVGSLSHEAQSVFWGLE